PKVKRLTSVYGPVGAIRLPPEIHKGLRSGGVQVSLQGPRNPRVTASVVEARALAHLDEDSGGGFGRKQRQRQGLGPGAHRFVGKPRWLCDSLRRVGRETGVRSLQAQLLGRRSLPSRDCYQRNRVPRLCVVA